MGKDSGTRFHIIAGILIAGMIAVLAWLFWMNHQRSVERESQYEQKEGEAFESRNDNKKLGSEALEYLRENMDTTDLVVWGDRLAAGNRDGVPAEFLQKTINERLIDKIAGELVTAGALSRPSSLWIRVQDMGVINEGMNEIMARAGTLQIKTGNEITLPEYADGKYLDLDIVDEQGNQLMFAKQRSAEIGKVTISDVEGHLYDGSEWYDEKHARLAFSRDQNGEQITIPKGSAIKLDCAEKYRDHTPILMVEDGGEAGFDASRINDLQEILIRHNSVGNLDEDIYVVVCATEEGSEADDKLSELFGDHYLRAEPDIDEMTEDDHAELTDRIYDCLDEQGKFDKVREAVEEAEKMTGTEF